jgi:hypothetical protein
MLKTSKAAGSDEVAGGQLTRRWIALAGAVLVVALGAGVLTRSWVDVSAMATGVVRSFRGPAL